MITDDDEVDVLVAGSGGGGLVGALTAAREGLRVALVEASDRFGGTTAYSGGGMWFPANPVLRRAGVDETVEDALAYYRAVVGDRTPASVQEAFVRSGAPLVAYLEQDPLLVFEPLPWPDYYGAVAGARLDGMRHMTAAPLDAARLGDLRDTLRPPLDTDRWGSPPPEELRGGQALIARLLLAVSAHPGVALRRSCPLVDLIVEDGVVVGAVVGEEGREATIRAKRGVLLATGGFEASDEMRRRYGVPGAARDTVGVASNTGRALQVGVAAGADTDLLDQAWWSPGLTHPDGRSAFALWFTGGIFVGLRGERFVNESAPYDRIGRAVIGAREAGTVGDRYWMVYDDREGVVPPVKAPNVSYVETERYQAAGLWRSADTLDDLAGLIGVPPENLAATVARYNEHCASGVDPDFGRGEEVYDRAFSGGASPMVPIERPPFHAAAFGISDLGTKGGLCTDARGRVLDPDGAAIPGLFATGNAMAAPSGTTYPAGGNPIGTSMVFAHLAAGVMARVHLTDDGSSAAPH